MARGDANEYEQEHMDKVAALGCIACRKLGYYDSPAQCHHIKTGYPGMLAPHTKTLPLCNLHHTDGGHGVAFHAGKEEWEKKFGSELDLLEEVYRMLGYVPVHREKRDKRRRR